MWWMLFPRWIWFLLGHCCALLLYMDSCRVRAMPMSMPVSVAKVVYSHAGLCPNDLNPNLWVDAMSTCMRECESDQVSEEHSAGQASFGHISVTHAAWSCRGNNGRERDYKSRHIAYIYILVPVWQV